MKLRRLAFTCSAAVVSLAVLTFVAAPASAAVFVPTTTADGADGSCDSQCTLREAVLAANASAGEDVILLHAGTYPLTLAGSDDTGAAGDLDVLDDLVVVGDGATSTTVDGGHIDRLFDVAVDAALELRSVTLRNGRANGGGAVRSDGSLTILDSQVLSNEAFGSAEDPAYGGGVLGREPSRLTVRNSTIHGNSAQAGGGGIAIAGQATLANVTIGENGCASTCQGGGLYTFARSRVTVNNATIFRNGAGRGGGVFAEIAAFIGVAPVITNSIIAANITQGVFIPGTDDPDCSGAIESAYNVVGTVGSCIGPSAAQHDVVGSWPTPVDPKLAFPIDYVGGPTATFRLLPGSPALDAGNPDNGIGACESTDQRGAARPAGPRCDIGAYERTAACVNGGTILCLNGDRFEVGAHFRARIAGGELSAPAQSVRLTDDTGYFWFFDRENVEVTVKVLNGCGTNQRFWVFASGGTNVEVVLTVTDTLTGAVRTYTNPLDHVYTTITDTTAFAACN